MARAVWAIWVVLTVAGGRAEASPDQARREEARRHFEAGQAHHKVGRFQNAIEEYQRAYDVIPLPDLLFNIGQCHRNLKDRARAIFFFERYLQEAPKSKDAEQVTSLIEELEEELAKEKERERASTATVARVEPPPPPPPAIVAAPIARVEEETPVHETWWFWTLLVAGVAGAAAGSVVAIRSAALPDGSLGRIDAR